MKKIFAFIALAIAFVAPSHADVTYLDSASFLAHTSSGFTNSFTGQPYSASPTYTNSGFSYTLSALGGLYSNGDFVGTSTSSDALTISFTGAPVTAIGANFYATDFGDAFQSVSITATLSDGTSLTYTPASVDAFGGFTTDLAITSLILSAPLGTQLYIGLDNLFVGTAGAAATNVPEPASLALFALGLAGLTALRRRAG